MYTPGAKEDIKAAFENFLEVVHEHGQLGAEIVEKLFSEHQEVIEYTLPVKVEV